ncbi:type I polyketide synthase [Myxococcus guangdongensis]|uniref:type I polyketide synthase n=1 Tax=Myxococcus guangdongensis TaxID=2906760 RepID=UPI0038993972
MSGRFPGARSTAELWANLRGGVESIRFFTPEESLAAGVAPEQVEDPDFVRASAVMPEPEAFDAAFFDMPPREAELTDPQHRVFLEVCWEAMEHAGYSPRDFPGAVSVYGGATLNTYLLMNLARNPRVLESVEPVQVNIGNGTDFLATRVSYKLNLRGASHAVQSACSTSLVAVHLACQSLLNGECDMALAGGASVNVSFLHGYRHVEGGMASPDGRCRPFDAKARGTLFGSGAGVVVLKKLKAAMRDGDTVHAVIKGSAINNDGSLKAGYTAPGVEGQAQVVAEALAASGLEADDIGYVEAHGTATPLGDPIEVEALTRAFRASTQRRRYCALGSVKGNLGHLDAAAGVTGLIKAAMAVKHGELPPSLHYERPNPAIDFDNSPFYVNATLKPWPATAMPRRAGVSSFGVGGTNAHVVLEQPPRPLDSAAPRRAWQVLPLSARTPSALEASSRRLAEALKSLPDAKLADVAWTLQAGRQRFSHRRVILAREAGDAVEALTQAPAEQSAPEAQDSVDRPVAFLFPGQGSQHVGMGRALYDSEPVFRAEVDRCATLLVPHLGGKDLRDVLYPKSGTPEENERTLARTELTQPALFTLEYATARLWMSWGVKPAAMLGHSIGEYVAACLAGVFTLEHALQLVAARGRLMQSLPSGAMLAVPLSEDEVRPYLGTELSLAAVNSPMQCVVSGPHEAVERVRRQLEEAGVRSHVLATSHAFHSSMMDPILDAFTARAAAMPLRPPTLPFVSNVTGTWITTEQATSPRYWAQHLRGAVRFADGLHALLSDPKRALLECGPGQVLSRLARRHPDTVAARPVLASMPTSQDTVAPGTPPLAYTTLGGLWLAGVTVDWKGFHGEERRHRLPLPTYPFERQRFWVEPEARSTASEATSAPVTPETALVQESMERWFHVPSWKRAPLAPALVARGNTPRVWMVFEDASSPTDALLAAAPGEERRVLHVRPGTAFSRTGDSEFTVAPGSLSDFRALLGVLRDAALLPDAVVHLWGLTPGLPTSFAQAQASGFHSLVALARALVEHAPERPCSIWVVTNHVHEVTGDEVLAPDKATVLGPCQVVSQEQPFLRLRHIDVVTDADFKLAPASLHSLRAELRSTASDTVVALRGPHRWVRTLEPLPLHDAAGAHVLSRAGGVYLLVHGLSGVGAMNARALANISPGAKLVCLEPADLPSREHWDAHLSQHGDAHPVSQRIRRARQLETLGAEVVVLTVDVTRQESLREAVDTTLARFGALHGAVYGAWLPREQVARLVSETGPEESAWHFDARVRGLALLDQVLGDRPLDFRVVASSISSVLGGMATVAHTAASAWQDTFAEAATRAGRRWVSLDWDVVRVEDYGAHPGARGEALDRLAISPEQGAEALGRVLAQTEGAWWVVSTHDPVTRQARPRAVEAVDSVTPAARTQHPRPSNLRSAYVAPTTEMERTLTELWQQTLGVAPIGIQDNFFELGGDSLIAVQLSDRLKRRLDISVPASSLYEGVTVKALAALLQPPEAGAVQSETDERESTVQRRKQNVQRQRSRRRSDDEDAEDEG